MGGAGDKTREGGRDTSRDGVVISRLSRPPPAPRGLSGDPFEEVQFLGFLRLMPPRSIPRSPRFPLLRGKSDKSPRQVSPPRLGERRRRRRAIEFVARASYHYRCFSVKGDFLKNKFHQVFTIAIPVAGTKGKYERSAREECVPCTRTRQLRARFKVHYARRQGRGGETVKKKVKRPGTRDFLR